MIAVTAQTRIVSFRQACVIPQACDCYGFRKEGPEWQRGIWRKIKHGLLNGEGRNKDANRFRKSFGRSRPRISADSVNRVSREFRLSFAKLREKAQQLGVALPKVRRDR